MTDPAIKLFGKTIPLRPHEDVPCTASNDQIFDASTSPSSSSLSSSSSLEEEQNQKAQQQPPKHEEDKDWSDQSSDETKKIGLTAPVFDESMEPATSTVFGGSTATTNGNMEATTENASKTQQEQNGTSNLKDQKTVKKPDKILPCPRCNSLDTKFCYYNNYNVNQPRHFCKNCQRYWTAGGTMRNVPVGAGRRKNKSSSSHYRHMTFSEALQTARNDMPQAIHHIPLKPNGTVLSFGSDSPLCESMASVLSLTEKAMRDCHRNGFHRPEEQRIPVSSGSCENGEEHSSGSSVTASNSGEDGKQADVQEPLARNCQGFAPPPPPVPCFPATPWTYPWNSAQWSPPVAAPAFCASSFPIPFYPAPTYWGCAIPGAWSIPWISPPSGSPTAANGSSGPNSPILGKHTREGDPLKQNDLDKEDALKQKKSSERCLWIPKTLRIDDPGEAARSSIWATLGIKKDKKGDGISGGGLFKAFQPKKEESNPNTEVLHANPAALSRFLNFQESS